MADMTQIGGYAEAQWAFNEEDFAVRVLWLVWHTLRRLGAIQL